jgi:branched-chain amino acid transport system substrate-binding protein
LVEKSVAGSILNMAIRLLKNCITSQLFVFISSFFFSAQTLYAETPVKVGVATVLTGDAAVIGTNIEKTISTYKKRYLKHPITFVFEDAKKGSAEGLAAYRRLVDVEKVDLLIGGTTSNGTLAGAPLVNASKTVLITPLTGGSNIDQAGPYIFRIGNSDVLNGYQQADLLLDRKLTEICLITEQTAYTTDMAKFFRERLQARHGRLVCDEEFLPDLTDFRSLILRIKAAKPAALFMSTQSGLAFGLFVKQFRQLSGDARVEIHTNFLSADNPEAISAAGDAINGVHYLAPAYDRSNPQLISFFSEFKQDHGSDPAIAFHTAGTVDALNMLQAYLSKAGNFSREGFQSYLLTEIKEYQGLMGRYSFDKDGNADIGFEPAVIAIKH